MRSKLVPGFLVVLALAAITACGGNSSNNTPPPVTVTVQGASSTVAPGGTDQFTATVTGSSSGVTWSIGGSDPGSISSSGLYTAPNVVSAPAMVTVTATLTSDSTKTGTATASVLQLTGITVSPRGPAVAFGANENFTATATLTDGTNTSTTDWTANSTWSSSATSIATITTGGVATAANTAGVTTITATDSLGNSITGTTAMNVTSMTMSNASLAAGYYVFSVTHAGIRGQGFAMGSFKSDGNGNITAGVVDFNAPQGSASDVNISGGSYAIYPDGRGTLSMTSQGTDTYSLILASDGSHGRMILSDATGVSVGTFQKQTSTSVGSGNFAILLGGMDGSLLSGSSTTQNPEVLAGQFSASGGTITNGIMDVNDSGTIDGTVCNPAAPPCAPPASASSFSASYTTTVDANGRGTVQVIPPSTVPSTQVPSSGHWTFAYYVVSSDEVLLIQTDQQGTPTSGSPTIAALTGSVEMQSATLADPMNSNYVLLVERSAAEGLFGAAGQWQFQTGSNLTGKMDINGATNPVSVANSTYTFDSSTGRGTVTVSALRSFVFYQISSAAGAGKMYILETDNKSNAGVANEQGSITLPSNGATLAFNIAQLATNGFDSSFSGQLTLSGTSLSGIADSNVAVNYNEQPGANQVTATSLSTPDATYGRGTLTLNIANQPGTTPLSTSYGYYLVSPTKMVIFGTSSSQAGYQPQDGSIEVQ
ncbi:MAG TPA: hypothetical protein VMG31_07215 [Verrucomicrobiae bacterium]|nr:hypothetical protein [Verrucomicrobiae bacterium]